MAVKRTFWWRGHPNFGDVLARDLVQNLTPYRPVWARQADAELVVVGSIATMMPRGWKGTVLGIGTARGADLDFSKARVLALRGHLSAEFIGGDPIAFGDPGLLADQLVTRPQTPEGTAIVPHWQDKRAWPKGARPVFVEDEPLKVIWQIAAAERVISSSLHGIIVADSFGIPRMWDPHPETQGDGFKFYDHATVVGPIEPLEWGVADPERVAQAKHDLLAAFAAL